MKFTLKLITLSVLSVSSFATHADRGWRKFSRETCADLLGHLRSKPLTIDNIFDEMDAINLGLIKDCGPGCWEYVDWSAATIPASQTENEHKVAGVYAESLLARNEGLFLFSRYSGIDIPAWDGLTFNLETGEITSRVSLKRGTSSHLLIEQGMQKAFKYSVAGGGWADLPLNFAKNPPAGWGFTRALNHGLLQFEKIGRWILADDERIKTRIVFMQPDHKPMPAQLPMYALRSVVGQSGDEIESVTIFDGRDIHEITNEAAEVTLWLSHREEQ